MLGGRESLWRPSPAPLRRVLWCPNCCQQGHVGAAAGMAIGSFLLLSCFEPGSAGSSLLAAT